VASDQACAKAFVLGLLPIIMVVSVTAGF
jgi:hypothetical protein